MMAWYEVVSPPYTYVEAILEDGTGPIYTIYDWLAVNATSARRAKVLALRAWRRRENHPRFRHEVGDWMHYGVNPFTGMKAKRFPAEGWRWIGDAENDLKPGE